MFDLWVSNIRPRTLVLIPCNQDNDFVLLLQHLVDNDSDRTLACSVKLVPLSEFDQTGYVLLTNQPIYGVVGLVEQANEVFLGVIHERQSLGELMPNITVFKCQTVSFYSLTTDQYDFITPPIQTQNSPSLVPANLTPPPVSPCQSLEKYLSTGRFYWSNHWDLTHSFAGGIEHGVSVEKSDFRFLWNEFLIQELLEYQNSSLPSEARQKLWDSGLLVRLIQGYVGVDEYNPPSVENGRFRIAVISRSGIKRAGARFLVRGIDDDGHVANYAESETIVWTPTVTFSFIQLRGSVPAFWEQTGLQLTSHRITITRPLAATRPAFSRHIEGEIKRYHGLHVLNLLSQKGDESRLAETYKELVALERSEGTEVGWTDLDFHKEMAREDGLTWIREMLMRGQIGKILEEWSMWSVIGDGSIVNRQGGVIRTNCLDCLDRTNVVQSIISQAVIQNLIFPQLSKLLYPLFPYALQRHATRWAENGDALSMMYAGTSAMKGNLTVASPSSGGGGLMSMLGDLRTGVQRVFQGVLNDEVKQETVDTLLGKMVYQRFVIIHDPLREKVKTELLKNIQKYAHKEEHKIFVGTFNVNAHLPTSESGLNLWLGATSAEKRPSLYVIGIEEIVQLTASQIVGNNDVENRALWQRHLLGILNGGTGSGGEYALVRSGQLVGTALMVFARTDQLDNIRNIEVAVKKTGLRGMTGNKGAVVMRFEWFDSSFCFVAAHFAAGQNAVTERNNDYRVIQEEVVFSRGRRIDDHENLIWLGDLNYRLDLEYQDAVQAIQDMDLGFLAKHDQLTQEMLQGTVFRGYREGQLTFPPTYKYILGTNEYEWNEKMRIPSWCDRILFNGKDLSLLGYATVDLRISDHRPVFALFSTQVLVIDQAKKEALFEQLMKSQSHAPSRTKGVSRTVSLTPRGVVPKKASTVSADGGGSTGKPPLPPRKKPPPRPTGPKPRLNPLE